LTKNKIQHLPIHLQLLPKRTNDLQSVNSRRTEREERKAQAMDAPKTGEFAHIGKSVVIKGELSGSEDLYVDGSVEGKIELRNHSLTVGPNGNVKADVSAKAVVVQGKLEGAVTASDRVDLRKSAVVNGDVTTQRIAIEEGAFLRGKVDIQKDGKAAGSATS
jgi:cytoskeletal protein CcmA (bactofilin family)